MHTEKKDIEILQMNRTEMLSFSLPSPFLFPSLCGSVEAFSWILP